MVSDSRGREVEELPDGLLHLLYRCMDSISDTRTVLRREFINHLFSQFFGPT